MDISLVHIFVKVAQAASFSRAAEILRMSKSNVSKSISRLEKETATRLLHRTTRSLSLTPAGQAFYESCVHHVQMLEDAHKALHGHDRILSGTVRLTAPEDLSTGVIDPLVGQLTRENPLLKFEVYYTDHFVDLVKEGFDLAVRIGPLNSSSLKAKLVGQVSLIPVASPLYLKGAPALRTPKDLAQHRCLALKGRSIEKVWHLKSKKATAKVLIEACVESNQMSSLVAMAAAGAGVALTPAFLCREKIQEGRLVRVLPEWKSLEVAVSIVSPVYSASSARLKLLSELLLAEVRKVL